MKPFLFKFFQIQQNKSVFRVGTDGVLLGTLANVKEVKNILEIGTGTGLIALMLAQRNPKAKITALDIDESAFLLAKLNFENSCFSPRLNAVHQDFKNYHSDITYDLIVSNPPYFPENNSEKDVLARQLVALDFKFLINKASFLLSNSGLFSVIIPVQSAEKIEEYATECNLFLVRKIHIRGIENGEIKRTILEFSKSESPLEFLDFVIEKSPRKYSDQYLELTKDFHVFGEK